jgi:taurine dioxygenase
MVHRIAGACGAEVTGLDLRQPLDAATVAGIRAAILEHQVLTFPGQRIDDDGLERFTRHFGPFGIEPFVEGEETHPHVIAVVKEADERRTANFGGNWHSDWSFQERPPSFTFLHARELPPFGGDTMFANQYLAWESLSGGLRRTLQGLRAVHSARRPYGPQGTYADRSKARSMKIQASDAALAEMVHPVARVHAETGRTALYVNRVYTIRFEGMTERESAPLLEYLYAQSVRPEFTCRIVWQPHALTMWDNRAVQHFAVNDYDGHRRELHRTTCQGERPLSVMEAPARAAE